jgi:hypothetical protein
MPTRSRPLHKTGMEVLHPEVRAQRASKDEGPQAAPPRRFWIGVASAQHVRIGRAGGFMQLCHGKGAPLRRLHPGDGIVYYSPTDAFGAKDGYQSFTAIGEVAPRDLYQADMGHGFTPMRRDVAWRPCHEVPIRPLLDRLQLTRGRSGWGYVFRFGLVEIGEGDFGVIGEEMAAIVR